jgi:hypothetical protein
LYSKPVLSSLFFPFGLSLSKPDGSPFDKLRANGLVAACRKTT